MSDSLLAKFVAFFTGSAVGVAAGVPPEYVALAVAMSADIITGVMCGFKGHRAASNTLKAGLKEKAGIGIAVGLCHVLEPIGFPPALTMVAVYGFISTEALSVIENLGALGVPMPDVIRRRLVALNPLPDDTPQNHQPETPDTGDEK